MLCSGVWCQHDEGWINPETRGLVIIGRSLLLLFQIQFSYHLIVGEIEELEDFICVGQDGWDGTQRAVLFVKLKKGYRFTKQLKSKIEKSIERELGDNVPEVILEIPDIPVSPRTLFIN
ncbi:acetoacetyl-CoA synthetase [Caerostris darwini]|uniref:Acetoacetyl-CoA synthetase n=1 Tax=Caerostris darwini TaxID=1538125 RepID=A0AAV4SU87_9ARAC|nr:acetoacetyl-CoA synthetase [Caerostris darwini]